MPGNEIDVKTSLYAKKKKKKNGNFLTKLKKSQIVYLRCFDSDPFNCHVFFSVSFSGCEAQGSDTGVYSHSGRNSAGLSRAVS